MLDFYFINNVNFFVYSFNTNFRKNYSYQINYLKENILVYEVIIII